MKPSELYARAPEDTWKDISILMGCYYKHLPELDQVWDRLDLSRNEKVEIHTDGGRYVDMLKYLSTLCSFKEGDQQTIDLVPPDIDIKDLETFYHDSLHNDKNWHRY